MNSIAELFNPFGALAYTGNRAPAMLNGGLDAFAPFLLLVAGGAAYLELQTVDNVYQTWLNTPKKQPLSPPMMPPRQPPPQPPRGSAHA